MPTLYLKVTASDINLRDVQEALDVYFPNRRATVEFAPGANAELVKALELGIELINRADIYGQTPGCWSASERDTVRKTARAALSKHEARK